MMGSKLCASVLETFYHLLRRLLLLLKKDHGPTSSLTRQTTTPLCLHQANSAANGNAHFAIYSCFPDMSRMRCSGDFLLPVRASGPGKSIYASFPENRKLSARSSSTSGK